MYRLGWPLWSVLGRLGVPIYIKLDVLHDREASVYVVTSRNLPGLVVEVNDKESAENFHREIDNCISLLLQDSTQPKTTVTVWPGEFAAA